MSPARLLVVDDDPDVREAMQLALELQGFEVETSANGREALESLKAHALPDVVLLDVMMPVMSGPQFLDQMRQVEEYAAIPVILVSAWSKEAQNLSLAQAFVPKPVDFEGLVSTIEHFTAPGDSALEAQPH